MTWQLVSKMLTAAAPSIANHLWQSTAFLAAASLLTLALRKNHARVRYGIWLASSIKFLIPFSLLIAAGGYLRPTTTMATPVVSAVMEQVTQPFSQTLFATDSASTVPAPFVAAHNSTLLPMILLSLWACGSLVVAFSWWRRWRTIRAAARQASYMTMVADVPVLSSPSLLEPGAFGIVRPVLLLPEGITACLTGAQLSAILAHEVCHVRRRDNLAAAMHMVVEAIFWFHPLVWWVGTRMVEERERACDEAVLRAGSEAHVYAEGILNVCKLYVESPLACVSGVTGSDLKKRIVRIMTGQVERKLDFSKKLLLSTAGLMAFTLPVVFGLVHGAQSQAQSPASNTAQDIAGTWQGTLHTVQGFLRIVVKITKADNSTYKAQFFSIDQTGQPFSADSVTLDGSTLKMTIKLLGGSYVGKLSADGQSIPGTWTQGQPLPLVLTRATPETAWTIPPPPPPIPPMAAAADPSFEVATIKPNNSGASSTVGLLMVRGRYFTARNTSLGHLISYAYEVQAKQVIGGPDWVSNDRYDIDAVPDQEGVPNSQQLKVMIRKLLADRFGLKFHHEKRELSAYVLLVGRNGQKLAPTQLNRTLPGFGFQPAPGGLTLTVRNGTMADFTHFLQSLVLDRPVVDQTGMTGRFDFQFTFAPDDSEFNGHPPLLPQQNTDATNSAPAAPGLFEAIQQQLGLKLNAEKVPVDVLVIDHIEKPSPN